MRQHLEATMGLLDLEAVKKRLKALHTELDHNNGKTTQQDIAAALNVPYRTFQSWENGEVETERDNYAKIARFYSRRLGRKITANWILFGQDEAPAMPGAEPAPGDPHAEQLDRIERKLDELLRRANPSRDDRDLEDLPDGPDSPPAPQDEDEAPTDAAGRSRRASQSG